MENTPVLGPETMVRYTVSKEDTLQKISLKFYGTTKKWGKIYNANKETLKAADRIYPGQTLNIPIEKLKEPQENLK
jgi:nucleoid-associated protein YgaU